VNVKREDAPVSMRVGVLLHTWMTCSISEELLWRGL